MQFRSLGTTGLQVSAISFGAGPVPAVMTAGSADRQRAVVARAIERGVNWFDTAATYGDGRSEEGLGRTLQELGASESVHLATKVRIPPDRVDRIADVVRESFAGSLARLRVPRVTLLQVHNSITRGRGDQPTSLTPQDVLGPGGMLEAFRRLRDQGKVLHFGITGLGDPESMAEVVDSGEFATVQTPYNVLNPSGGADVKGRGARGEGREAPDLSAGQRAPSGAWQRGVPKQELGNEEGDADYGGIISHCRSRGVGVFAIRVFAGGALTGQPPSEHTKTTKFFPLALYQRDLERAVRLQQRFGSRPLAEVAVRFALSHAGVTSALLGFSAPEQVDEAMRACEAGVLPAEDLEKLKE